MARIITTGFEVASVSALEATTAPDGQLTTNGSPTVTMPTTNPRSGKSHLRVVTNAALSSRGLQAFTFSAITLGNDFYLRVYFYLTALPTSTNVIALASISSTTGIVAAVELTSAGLRIRAWNPTIVGARSISSDQTIKLGTWNCIEIRVRVGTGSVDEFEGRLDQKSSFHTATALDLSDGQINGINIGSHAIVFGTVTQIGNTNELNHTLDYDDVAANDSSGAAQNSWPGLGKIALHTPAGDNAVGTGWALGTGTAIAGGTGATAVKNTPPVGVADLTAGSDTKQIRNATSNANVNYDANMESYSAVGINSSDTITVVVPIIATAAPVTTSSKQGTVGVVSNPTIANIALGAGGTAGAFWSGVAAGSYPTGWKWSQGTITYNPAVTKATQPVMRVTQVTASTRIAMVCFMGMYVEYIPQSSLVANTPGSAHARHRRAAQSFDRW